MSNKIEYISYEELLNVYAKTIANSGGGLSGIRDDGGIQSLLQFVQDDEYYPNFVDKLTYLVYGFCHGHYFLDGNKRISLTVGVYFLISQSLTTVHCAVCSFILRTSEEDLQQDK